MLMKIVVDLKDKGGGAGEGRHQSAMSGLCLPNWQISELNILIDSLERERLGKIKT